MSSKLSYRIKTGEVLPRDTPSNLSIYKEPLEPVENGYGYAGTIAKDKTGNYIQCHVCGYFFESLSGHIGQTHKVPVKEYREVFGIAMTTKLVGEATYRRASQAGQRNYLKRLKEKPETVKRQLDQLKKGQNGSLSNQPYSLERRNKRGICEAQTLDMITTLAKKLGRTPTRTEFIDEYQNKGKAPIYYYFGTWGNALKAAGLEPR